MKAVTKAKMSDVIKRAQFLTRLNSAVGVLRACGLAGDEAAAVEEAIEIIRAQPWTPLINEALYPKTRWQRSRDQEAE
jgi:hypothetical protein